MEWRCARTYELYLILGLDEGLSLITAEVIPELLGRGFEEVG
jgi:hypothetical protein